MICVVSAGSDAPGLGARLQIGSGFSGECVRTRQLLRCDDSELDVRVDRETCRALGVRSIVAVPIFCCGAIAGLMEMFSPNAQAFSKVPDPAFEHFAEEASIALSGLRPALRLRRGNYQARWLQLDSLRMVRLRFRMESPHMKKRLSGIDRPHRDLEKES